MSWGEKHRPKRSISSLQLAMNLFSQGTTATLGAASAHDVAFAPRGAWEEIPRIGGSAVRVRVRWGVLGKLWWGEGARISRVSILWNTADSMHLFKPTQLFLGVEPAYEREFTYKSYKHERDHGIILDSFWGGQTKICPNLTGFDGVMLLGQWGHTCNFCPLPRFHPEQHSKAARCERVKPVHGRSISTSDLS